ncbi:MAG: hypothetical protein K1X74_18665 [Pirellulales bacterium]|nr:hypothetical protein [Pirellulales bacterium]
MRTAHRMVTLAACTAALICLSAEAAEPQQAALEFRRAYVPADRVDDWPLAAEAYFPVAPAEFERLVDLAERAGAGLPIEVARLQSAEYELTADDQSLVGQGRFAVEMHGTEPGWLGLHPCNFAVVGGRWQGTPAQPVRLAMNAAGQLIVFVEKSGQLELDLVRRQVHGGASVALWRCELPAAARSRLQLRLPADIQAACNQGVWESPAADSGLWQADLGGTTTFEVRTMRRGSSLPVDASAELRQSIAYRILPQGLEASASLTIGPSSAGTDRVRVALARPLQVISVSLRGQPLPWAPDGEGNSSLQRFVVQLPETTFDTVSLQVIAVAPWPEGTEFSLPRFELADVTHGSHRVALVVPAPLVVSELSAPGYRQSKFSRVAGDSPGETFEFERTDPEASIHLVIQRALARAAAELVTHWEIGPTLRARIVGRFHGSEGERTRLEADVQPGWTVSAVEASPTEALAGWQMETDDATGARLVVRLNSALANARSVQLTVEGTSSVDLSGRTSLRLAEAKWLRYRDVQIREHWLHVRAQPPMRIEAGGDRSNVTRADLGETAQQLLSTDTDGLLFDLLESGRSRKIDMARQRSRYRAACRNEIWAERQTWLESLSIRCVPEEGPLDRIVVQATDGYDWQWTCEAAGPDGLVVTPLDDLGPGLQAWELRMLRPQTVPVVFRAKREVAGNEPLVPTLVSVPEATEQSGLLALGAGAHARLRLSECHLEAAPVDPPADASPAGWTHGFAYEPATALAATGRPLLVVNQAEQSAQHTMQLWQSRCVSRLQPTGLARHTLTYRLENPAGAPDLDLEIPAQLTVRRVSVDGEVVPRNFSAARLRVALPRAKRLATIVIEAESTDRCPDYRGRFSFPWPKSQASCNEYVTTLVVPERYACHRVDQAASRGPGIVARLWGPLAPSALDERVAQSRLGEQLPASSDEASPGWAVYEDRGSDPARLAFELTDRSVRRAWGWAGLITALGLAALLLRWPRAWAVWCGTVVLTALCAPGETAHLAGYAALGTLLSLLSMLSSRPSVPQSVVERSSVRRAGTVAVASTALLLFVSLARLCSAQLAAPQRWAEVLIPVGADREPTGDRYQVPARLYDALHRVAARASGLADPWLIEEVIYELAPREDNATSTSFATGRLLVRIQSFVPRQRVTLPWGGESAPAALDGARLAGRPVEVQWDVQRRQIEFEIPQAGASVFELPFEIPNSGTGAGELRTVPFALAKVRLVPYANRAANWRVTSAIGPVQENASGASLVVMGPADRLRLEANAAAPESPPETESARVEVEQMIWLRPQASSTVANVRCRYRVLQGSVRTLRLKVDPALSLPPFTGASSSVARARLSSGELTLDLAQPCTDRVTVDLTFLLRGGGEAQTLVWPELQPLEATVVSRQIAVTLGDLWQAKAPAAAGFIEQSVAEFATAWGQRALPPSLAYRATEANATWSLPLGATRVRATAVNDLCVRLGRTAAEFRWQVTLLPAEATPFQYRALVPAELEIDEVSVSTPDVEHVARWSLPAAGQLNVFLSEPIDTPAVLRVGGRLPLGTPGTCDIEPLALATATDGPRRVFVFRQHDVLANVAMLPPWQFVADALPEGAPTAWGQPIGGWSGPNLATLEAKVQANEPSAQLTTVVALDHEADDRWSASLAGRLLVSAGVVDRLQFEVPAEWTGPYAVESEGTVRLAGTTAAGGRILEIEPAAPVAQVWQFRIRGPLVASPGRPQTTPRIVCLDAQADRYYRLPTQANAALLGWELRDLAADELPAGFEEGPVGSDATTVYRAISDDASAALRLALAADGMARVRLADIRVVQVDLDQIGGIASYDLEPGGMSQVEVELPPACTALQWRMAEVPADPERVAARRWRLRLASPRLPQRLELQFRISRSELPADATVLAPQIVDLPVERTVWTAPAAFRSAAKTGRSVGPLPAAMLRIQAATELLKLGAAQLADSPAELRTRWYLPWQRRWQACRADVAAQLALAPPSNLTAAMTTELRLIDEEQAKLRTSLLVDLSTPAGNNTTDQDDFQQLAASLLASDERALSWEAAGELPALQMKPSRAGTYSPVPRFLCAALALLVAAWCVFGDGLAWLTEQARRWSALVCVAVGALWWAALQPAWIGPVLVILGLWRAWRGVPLERPVRGSVRMRSVASGS